MNSAADPRKGALFEVTAVFAVNALAHGLLRSLYLGAAHESLATLHIHATHWNGSEPSAGLPTMIYLAIATIWLNRRIRGAPDV